MAARELLSFLIVLLLLASFVTGKDASVTCEIQIERNPRKSNFKLLNNNLCDNTSTPCANFKTGRYICEQRCTYHLHIAVGLGITTGLMFILLVISIVGWTCTCCLLHKTTDFSLQPKGRIQLNQYQDTLQSERNNHFHSKTSYTRFGQSQESAIVQVESNRLINEEGIYEVLDGEEEQTQMKTNFKNKQNVTLSGGAGESYNTLHFEKTC